MDRAQLEAGPGVAKLASAGGVTEGDRDREDLGRLFMDLEVRARAYGPIRTAVVHPVDSGSLLGTVQAARAGLIVPVLVGPRDRIRSTAQKQQLDLRGVTLIDAKDAPEAAHVAVALARSGEVQALMKGYLRTDELMHAALEPVGLRTDRRMSHVFVHDAPRYARPLLITDAVLNIAPNLEIKRAIVQNAVELALAIGIEAPRVAVLSALETVTSSFPSSVEAAALAKMGDRGQITGAVIDGPLAFDDAVSVSAARAKQIVSPVAGRADILVVPDLECGTVLSKQLQYLGGSRSAGLVVGASVPIALTSRGDGAAEHFDSCLLAVLAPARGGPGSSA